VIAILIFPKFYLP